MTLVYDFVRGDVIDSDTGLVVDRVYVSRPVRALEEGSGLRERVKGSVVLRPETRLWLKLMEKRKGNAKLAKAVIKSGRLEAAVKGGRQVRVFEVPLPTEPGELLRKIVNEVLPKYPTLNSRTLRAKYVVAAVLLNEVRGEGVSAAVIAERFGTSRTHVWRVMRELRALPYRERVINDVRKVVRE